MKQIKNLTLLATIGLIATSAQAVDLSKVPDLRKVNLSGFNESEVAAGRRPRDCNVVNYDKAENDPVCFDGVISENASIIRYAGELIRLGKPLTEGNKARENKEGLQAIINKIKSVYAGTEEAILNKEPELNLVLAGLFNTFNRSITAVEPYVLSIANGHYDKETLEKLDLFDRVFSNGWKSSAGAMVQYKGISQEKADGSTNYYRKQIHTIRHIVTQLNKYYQ